MTSRSAPVPQRKIAIYIPNFAGGGAEAVSVRLANEFGRIGQPVDIVVNEGSGVFRADVSSAVRIVDLGSSRTMTALPRLRAYLRDERPAALISGLLFNNLNALIARYSGGWRGRLILCQHNTFSIEARQNRKSGIYSAIFARAARGADCIVAVSQGVADDLARTAKLGPDRVSVIYNPIITEDFSAKADLAADHPWLRDTGVPVFVAVGRLVPQKDYPTLLKALERLRRKRPARLLVLGEGVLLGELTVLAQKLGLGDAVAFVGFQANPLPFISRAAALVLSSAFEGFGNVLAEALACGTPVISTACNGPVEILDNGRYGDLVPIGDDAALAEAMDRVLDTRPDASVLRGAAERFHCSRIARQYIAMALGRDPA